MGKRATTVSAVGHATRVTRSTRAKVGVARAAAARLRIAAEVPSVVVPEVAAVSEVRAASVRTAFGPASRGIASGVIAGVTSPAILLLVVVATLDEFHTVHTTSGGTFNFCSPSL